MLRCRSARTIAMGESTSHSRREALAEFTMTEESIVTLRA
jgi:hypothetical protein